MKKTALLVFGFFWLRGALFLDPDFGWHLRMGQLILAHGIPLTDPFSYTMPSYPFVDHEWLTNILFAQLFPVIGYTGLSALFAFFATAALFLQVISLSAKAKRVSLIPLVLAAIVFSEFVGVRAQVVTWLFFSVLLFVLRDASRFEKYQWGLPLLFLFWVNLHGGFAVGIAVLLLRTVYVCFKNPSKRISAVLLFVLCLAVTCVTPYGYRNWWEVWMQMTDGSLRWTIQEWMPGILTPSMPFWAFFMVSLIFFARYGKRFALLDLLLYGGLLIGALSSIRHIPLWIVIALPLTSEAIGFFVEDSKKIPFAQERFRKAVRVFLIIIFLVSFNDLRVVLFGLGFFGQHQLYPQKGVAYLKEHLPQGEVFASYDLGGYLLWQLPQKKVFVDGRMPSWRWSANLPHESNYAFSDYRQFVAGQLPFASVIKKYNITTLLLPAESVSNNPALVWLAQFQNRVFHVPLPEASFAKLIQEAKRAGWSEVYKDETVAVLISPQLPQHPLR